MEWEGRREKGEGARAAGEDGGGEVNGRRKYTKILPLGRKLCFACTLCNNFAFGVNDEPSKYNKK
jgi:hypothetical protein